MRYRGNPGDRFQRQSWQDDISHYLLAFEPFSNLSRLQRLVLWESLPGPSSPGSGGPGRTALPAALRASSSSPRPFAPSPFAHIRDRRTESGIALPFLGHRLSVIRRAGRQLGQQFLKARIFAKRVPNRVALQEAIIGAVWHLGQRSQCRYCQVALTGPGVN
jgi:hypothetical protein